MTRKYVAMTAPKSVSAGDDYWASDALTITVHETDAESSFTGIVDANGVPLYRVEQREPIGFRVR